MREVGTQISNSNSKMSPNVLPSPEPGNYEDFKTLSNENIKGYELILYAIIEKSSEGAGWNINIMIKTDKLGFTIYTMNCEDLKKNLEQQFKGKYHEVILTNVRLLQLFLANEIWRRWCINFRRV